MIFIQDWERE